MEKKRGNIMDHQPQILMEERLVIRLFTNVGFFFAGNDTVFMPHHVVELSRMVLALYAHS